MDLEIFLKLFSPMELSDTKISKFRILYHYFPKKNINTNFVIYLKNCHFMRK